MLRWLLPLLTCLAATNISAEVVTRAVEYKYEGQVLEGQLVFDTASSGKRPGLLLAHDSGGASGAARQRAQQWARLGYVVFTLDLYGKGLAPKSHTEAADKSGASAKDRTQMRGRAEAGLATLAKQSQVDARRVVGIGFGPGGTALLELARGGADLEGIACYHCDLSARRPAEAKQISAAVLVLLGSDDPLIPIAQMTAFEEEMRGGGVDWQILRFGGAVHDFSNPQAGRNLKSGSAYDADADRRANEAVKLFLAEALLATKPALPPKKTGPAPVKGVPDKVFKVLEHVDEHHAAPAGFEGGRTFLNLERHLPQTSDKGQRTKYREWDVNPLRPGVNRGPERLVTGSDGSAYFTDDHYKTFKKIR